MSERASTKGRERPILFSAPMVRALLDGRKTQTRRIVKDVPPQPAPNCHPSHTPRHPAPYLDSYCGQPKTAANPRGMSTEWMWWQVDDRCGYPSFKVKFAPGDRLWVRESWMPRGLGLSISNVMQPRYRADAGEDRPEWRGLWKPPIHMPRRASRLTLTVTNVRVQRLQEISEEDAAAEGMDDATAQIVLSPEERHMLAYAHIATPHALSRIIFETVWEQINGPDSWPANPWVAAYTFTVERRNIDEGRANLADATPTNPLSEGRERS